LKELAPAAEKAGVDLGLEDTISAEDNVRIMERAGSPAVRVYYDVGNSTNNGFDVVKGDPVAGRTADLPDASEGQSALFGRRVHRFPGRDEGNYGYRV
jgi:hypothetical protein